MSVAFHPVENVQLLFPRSCRVGLVLLESAQFLLGLAAEGIEKQTYLLETWLLRSLAILAVRPGCREYCEELTDQ